MNTVTNSVMNPVMKPVMKPVMNPVTNPSKNPVLNPVVNPTVKPVMNRESHLLTTSGLVSSIFGEEVQLHLTSAPPWLWLYFCSDLLLLNLNHGD